MTAVSATVDLTKPSSDRHGDRHRSSSHRTSSSSTSSSSHRSHSSKSHHSSKPHHSSSSRSSSHSSSHRSSSSKPAPPPAASDSLLKKTSQFQFDPVFTNTLPLPPSAPKRLLLPTSTSHLTAYCGGLLLSTYRSPLLTDDLLSLPLNFINPPLYITPPNPPPLSPSSLSTFLPSSTTLPRPLQPTRAQLYKQGYSNWARKPEYTSNNLYTQGNAQLGLTDLRKKEVLEVSRRRSERQTDSHHGQLVERIERTFEQAQHIPVHPRKKNVYAQSILPVLPSEGKEGVMRGWVEFDSDPKEGGEGSAVLVPVGEKNHAVYVGGEGGEEGGVWRYGRDYELLPTPAVDVDNNYYFVMQADGVVYGRYGMRMRLGKRMKRGMKEEEELMEGRAKEVKMQFVEGAGNGREGEGKEGGGEGGEDKEGDRKRRRVKEDEEEEQEQDADGDEQDAELAA